jgi:hypothetical protein
MTAHEPVPHVEAGAVEFTADQREAINTYSKTDIELWLPGRPLTNDMCNRAIDWFNEMRGT